MLETRGLRVVGDRVLVDGVDLTVAAGETVGLVGESGSGKSLTARALVGLLPRGLRAEGSVEVGGTQVVGASERLLRGVRGRRISLLMQDPFTMLNPLSTAGAHIAETLPGRTSRQEIARRLAEVGIDDPAVAGRHPFQLSGGMRQRVALAAALAGDPELLIADEPTTALDATTQHEILALLRRVQEARGMGVLLITHDLRVAFAVCDRVAVMYAGRVVEQGPGAELAAAPAHPYTSGLLGALPSVERAMERLVGIPGSVPRADEVAGVCAFATRCDLVAAACTEARPPLRPIGRDRLTACVHDAAGTARPPLAETASLTVPTAGPADGEPLLHVEGLRKRYGAHTALGGVSLHVNPGETVGLVGESGSGKTTLARSVLGLVTPDGGRIRLAGLDITDRAALDPRERARVHRLVQCVFQDPSTSLNPAMTVGAALAEASARAAPGDRIGVAELLELVGLPAAYAARRPKALSGGQRQRVAIARALAVRPALLICDEPVASLDVSVQAHVLELLRGIGRDLGTGMLFITHDLAVVRQIAARTVVLLKGAVVEEGTTSTVLDAPAHDYTRRLVSAVR
ncbi:ABC transporter ATP-binding protein [Nonomuraea roseoviolacea subsp. roseoviolacea]|uniref:Peptide/nickel transport system ATP-binding protein n=1 Tax=Nonomuraea roseoviolacea subsp. carminata TaxID=160689 RepID=A0ABT1KC57_9ACTN|nr:ABC transporter ATP-binding protein [Nonomuraea roseoviolacea]MCP2351590.1 peptide/nickel transport system ATP-binding protein [Nonomuraea roseoviolacea subsp. carminata]